MQTTKEVMKNMAKAIDNPTQNAHILDKSGNLARKNTIAFQANTEQTASPMSDKTHSLGPRLINVRFYGQYDKRVVYLHYGFVYL